MVVIPFYFIFGLILDNGCALKTQLSTPLFTIDSKDQTSGFLDVSGDRISYFTHSKVYAYDSKSKKRESQLYFAIDSEEKFRTCSKRSLTPIHAQNDVTDFDDAIRPENEERASEERQFISSYSNCSLSEKSYQQGEVCTLTTFNFENKEVGWKQIPISNHRHLSSVQYQSKTGPNVLFFGLQVDPTNDKPTGDLAWYVLSTNSGGEVSAIKQGETSTLIPNPQAIQLGPSRFHPRTGLFMSVITDGTMSTRKDPSVYFSIAVTQFEDGGGITTKIIPGKCKIKRQGRCMVYTKVIGHIKDVVIGESQITIGVEMLNSQDLTGFCAVAIEDVAECFTNGGQKCLELLDTRSVRSPILQNFRLSKVQSLTTKEDKDFLFVAGTDEITGLDSFRTLVFTPNGYSDFNHEIIVHGLTSILSLPQSMHVHQFVISSSVGAFLANQKIYMLSSVFPTCKDASNCFECQSNVFGLNRTCSWLRKCFEVSKTESDIEKLPTCPPKIHEVNRKVLYNEGSAADVTLFGSCLSPSGNVTCQRKTRSFYKQHVLPALGDKATPDEETTVFTPSGTSVYGSGILFYIEKEFVENKAVSISCTVNLQQAEMPQFGITYGAATIELPHKIPVEEPVPLNFEPKALPLSTGSLLTVTGEWLWPGTDPCYPELQLEQNGQKTDMISRYYSRSTNSTSFLVPPLGKYGGFKTSDSYDTHVFITSTNDINRNFETLRLSVGDPEQINIIQNATLLRGGLDIVLEGKNLASVPEPVMWVTIDGLPEKDILGQLEPQKCSVSSRPQILQNRQRLYCTFPKMPRELLNSDLNITHATITFMSNKSLEKLNCDSDQDKKTCGFHEDILKKVGSQNRIEFVDAPIINKIAQPNALKLSSAKDRFLNITFSNMRPKWLELDLVKVYIGQWGECKIFNFTNVSLTCKAPELIPKQEGIYVFVGSDYAVKVGTFYYEKETSMFLLYVTIGSGTAFILIFLFISLVVYLHTRKKRKQKIANSRDPNEGSLMTYQTGALGAYPENPISALTPEEREQLMEFTDTEGMSTYASQRIAPSLICSIQPTPIGHGQFGEVYKGTLMYQSPDGTESWLNVALKCVRKKEKLAENKQIWLELISEGESMTDFSHPNVLGMLGFSYISTPKKIESEFCIVLPFMNSNNLGSYIRKHKSALANDILTNFTYQAACGMRYLHEKGILHQDLAARNCMLNIDDITNEIILKVSDFGLSTKVSSQQKTTVLPVMWCAPELLAPRVQSRQQTGNVGPHCQPIWSKEADVWAYGILVWEIFHEARKPYCHLGEISQKELEAQIVINQETPQIGQHVELATIVEVMDLCWHRRPKDRPNFQEICEQLEKLVEGSLGDYRTQTDEAFTNNLENCIGFQSRDPVSNSNYGETYRNNEIGESHL